MKTKSEFGKGLTYCIGLFLAHSERKMCEINGEIDYSMWFNGASDHLYELDVSSIKNKALIKRLIMWQEKVIYWGHGFKEPRATEKDFTWSIQQAKDFLREIDNSIIGVKVTKGSWE